MRVEQCRAFLGQTMRVEHEVGNQTQADARFHQAVESHPNAWHPCQINTVEGHVGNGFLWQLGGKATYITELLYITCLSPVYHLQSFIRFHV